MQLTLDYSRVAMIKFVECPWCGMEISDWFMEWYPKGEFDRIKNGDLPMDCPVSSCRMPVLMHKGNLFKAPQEEEAAIRPIEGAKKWLRVTQAPWSTLMDFLMDPEEQSRVKYFRSGYWPGVNV